MNERILMKLAEAEKKRGLTETQRAMLGGALGVASGLSLGGVLLNKPATRKQLAAAAAAGALLGLGETALQKRLRRQAANANLQKTAAYGDFVRNLGRNYERKVGREYLDAFKKFREATGKVDRASFEEANKLLAKRLARSHAVGRAAHKYAPAITTGAIGLGAAGAAAGGIAAARAIKNKRQGQEKTASYYAVKELLGLQKEAAYGDTIKNLAGRVGSGARNAFQKFRNTPYGDTIQNLASRVGSGARNAFQGLRNTPGIIKSLQQQNLARGAIQFAQRNAKALTAGGIGLGAAGAVAGGIAAARAIKNKRQGQEKTASYYAARELLGLQKEANLTLAGSQNVKEISAKDQILKMIRKKKTPK